MVPKNAVGARSIANDILAVVSVAKRAWGIIGDGLEPKNVPDSTFNEKKRETTGAREDLILEKKEMRTQLVFGPQNENGTD